MKQLTYMIVGALLAAPYPAIAGTYDAESEPNFDIGVGYDAVKGEVRGDCVNLTPVSTPYFEGERVTFSLTQIEEANSLKEALKISASASLVGKVGSIGGKAEIAR